MLAPATDSTLVNVPARNLLPGDVTGSGETVVSVSAGARTPRGKVNVLLQKDDQKRSAVWGASTVMGVRRNSAPLDIPLSDRLPTFHELATFDAGETWDALTPAQKREIGVLALRFGTIGQCGGYFHETLDGVREGFESSHWSPEVQATAVWPGIHVDLIESAAQASFQAFCDHFDPLWPHLFGWQAGRR